MFEVSEFMSCYTGLLPFVFLQVWGEGSDRALECT